MRLTGTTGHRPIVLSAILLAGLVLAGCGPIDRLRYPDLSCPIPIEPGDEGSEDWVAFTLENEACATICSLYISPTFCDYWGTDRLGNNNLHPGDSATVYVPPGPYDLLVEECTEDAFQSERHEVTEDYALTIFGGDGEDSNSCTASITVENGADTAICHMWIAGPASERFGLNWRGDEQIASGDSFTFSVYPGSYDVKAEDCDFILLRTELDVDISGHVDWTVP